MDRSTNDGSDGHGRDRKGLVPRLAFGLAAAALLAVGGAAATTSFDGLVNNGFARALEQGSAHRIALADQSPEISGTEDFWLRRRAHVPDGTLEPAAWTETGLQLKPGDRLTVASNGINRTLEVVSVVAAPDKVTRTVESSERAFGRTIVTARDVGDPSAPLIRLSTEAEPAGQKSPARVL